MNNLILDKKVTRIEVIDHTQGGEGRAYVKRDDALKVELDFQDDGRTLKIFLSNNPEK